MKAITRNEFDGYEHQIVLASAANLRRQSKKLIYRFKPNGHSMYVVTNKDKIVFVNGDFGEAIEKYNSIDVPVL